MNYYGAKDLAESFRTVRKNTIQVAEDIPGEQVLIPRRARHDERRRNPRAPRHLAALGAAVPLRREEADRDDGGLRPVDGRARRQVQGARRQGADRRPAQVQRRRLRRRDRADDRRAARRTVGLPMGDKTRFEMLLGVKEHEMHHRAQLFLIERMIGIVPHLTRARQERWRRRAAA